MPRLAAFPKAWMAELCRTGTMTLDRWLDIAADLELDGVELYAGMLDLQDASHWRAWRREIEARALVMPMFCCSPDFAHPDAAFRRREIERQHRWIDMTAALGGRFCRVLSGQRRDEVTLDEGLRYAADGIAACLPYAAARHVTLTLENHYKDDFWTHPELARQMDVFCDLVARVDALGHANFGVNYDPSNALLAGDDPLELLRRVRHRVVTMHASDRHLADGTLDDLRREEHVEGYARRLLHGEIGQGLNDYEAIFGLLRDAGFDGWISIEDGVDGLDQLRRSVQFVRGAMARAWP